MIIAIDPGNEQSAWVLYDEQNKMPIEFAKEPNDVVIEQLKRLKGKTNELAIEMIASYGMSVGQAQPLTSKILTPNGFIKMKDISIKDKIIGIDGKPHNVLGVFFQGTKRKYKISFTDKSYTYCCKDHLWGLLTPNRKRRGSSIIVKKTEDILSEKIFLGKGGYKYVLPKNPSISCFDNKEDLVIHPYIMGALLGDGSMNYTSVHLTSSENFIPNKIKSLLPNFMELRSKEQRTSNSHRMVYKPGGRNNPFLTFIRKIKVNVVCHNKFIPSIYKFRSVEDRVHLLHGLMDTDGFIDKEGRFQYDTVSKKLKNDFCFLIRSLGGSCSFSLKKRSEKNKKHKDKYTISFCLPDHIKPCSMPRKVVRVKKQKKDICRSLKSIEDTGVDVPMQCIMTDAPENLYMTDDLLLTHNTIFDTCVWIGRYHQLWKEINENAQVTPIFRKDVKMHICGLTRAKDTNIRQAIMDRYGSDKKIAIGNKKEPGPLYGVKSDIWAALGVAITYCEADLVGDKKSAKQSVDALKSILNKKV